MDVTIRNDGGKTNLTEGHFWISRSDDPAYKDEKHLIEFEMPKGKEENFFFYIKLLAYQQIVKGDSILKFGYELHFYGPNQQTETSKKSYRYAPQKDAFIIE